MSIASVLRAGDRRAWAHLIPATALLVWLVLVCVLPDPRPLGAPEWAVRGVRAVAGVSEPAARLAATILFRGVGVGMIGILMAGSLGRLRMLYATPLVLVASPVLAVVAKWINFGYFPITPQFLFILAVAILGSLAGLALRRSRIALAGLMILAAGLSVWGVSTGIPDDLYEASRATAVHVLEFARDVPQGDDGFARLLEVAFAYAEDNSHGTDAVLPNRAAILALGVILGEDRVARVGGREIDPGREEERAALRQRIGIHGRTDLSQHFWVSAALTVLSDAQRSLTVGITKEMMDSSPGGSGFSFVDMAANKAGIRFAVVATRNAESAHAAQLRIRRGVHVDDLFPDVDGLPEGISRDELQSEFGGLGGAETRRLFEVIDRRLGAREFFQ